MKKLSKVFCWCLFSIIVVVHSEDESEVPEALQDLQTEFWLPYSVTEDVDFTISRPDAYGCYQWSVATEQIDLIRLDPHFLDYSVMCGNKLEFQVLPRGPKESVDIVITGENAKMDEFDHGVPAVVEYTVHIRPVAKLEVMGLRTELNVGGEPAPFGVAAYDAEENEFDSLDGVQISWYIGAKRSIGEFEKYLQKGPITKVIPTGAGTGVVIAVLTDPNYRDKLEMATLEITVASQFIFEPDSVYLLEGAKVKVKVMEMYGEKKIEVNTGKEKDEFYLDIKDPEMVVLDKKKGELTGLKEGETTIFVKNSEGEIVRGMPIWVTSPRKIVITSYPNPHSKELILGQTYDIKVDIYNKEDKLIYPSENILAWTQFPGNFEVLEVSESMLTAKIKAISQGLGKLKVALRSVLNEEDEEMEITPHIKMSKDFEVYPAVTLSPLYTILPWDDNVKPAYDIFYKAEGGGKAYLYNVSDSELATIDNEGKLITHGGPGEFSVKAYMPKTPENFAQSTVSVLPPTRIEFASQTHEYAAGDTVDIRLKATTFLPEAGDEIMYTQCSDIPYEIKLSDNENFNVTKRSKRTDHEMHNACASFTLQILAKEVDTNLKCVITIKYFEPSSGRTLRAKTTLKVYNKLKTVWPEPRKSDHSTAMRRLFLAVGSSVDVVLKGGPRPWFGEPLDHFIKVIDDSPETIRVIRNEKASGKVDLEAKTFDDLHVYTATCLAEGSGQFAVMVGNYIREESKDATPQRTHVETEIVCSIPSKLIVLASGAKENIAIHPKSGKFMSVNNKDVDILITVKDKKGRTYDSIESLDFDVKVSDEDLLDVKKKGFVTPRKPFKTTTIQGKPYQTMVPKGKDGAVEVTIKLNGYNQVVLDKNEVKNPPPLPKVLDEEEEEDYEPVEGENVSSTLIDYVTINLTPMQEIEKLNKQNP